MVSQPDEQCSAPSSPPARVIGSDAYKQMEEALRASEARFRTQFESTPVPTFIWQVARRQFTLIDVNAAAEHLTLGKAHTFLGMTAEQLYADRPDLLERFQACLEQQAVIVYETPYHAHGTRMDRIIVFTFAYVSPELILLHADDITERKQAEDAHRAGEANMIALLENTDGSIWSVDREYRLVAGNSVFRRDIDTALGRAFAVGECVLSRADAGAMNDLWRAYYDRALRGERFSVESARSTTARGTSPASPSLAATSARASRPRRLRVPARRNIVRSSSRHPTASSLPTRRGAISMSIRRAASCWGTRVKSFCKEQCVT